MDWFTLGDVQVHVFRQLCAGIDHVFASPVVLFPHPQSNKGVPAQAAVYDKVIMDDMYIEGIFKHAKFQSVQIMEGDTVLVVSDGVADNVSQTTLSRFVESAYLNKESPDTLAAKIVAEALSSAYRVNGCPDDTTCAVGYVCAS